MKEVPSPKPLNPTLRAFVPNTQPEGNNCATSVITMAYLLRSLIQDVSILAQKERSQEVYSLNLKSLTD